METNLPLFSANPYICNVCNIVCSKKNDWNRHLHTTKHKKKYGNIMETQNSALLSHDNSINLNNTIFNSINYNCYKCNKQYFSNSGLWKHKKKCIIVNDIKSNNDIEIKSNNDIEIKSNNDINPNNEIKSNNDIKTLTKLVLELVKSNNELQNQMIEVCKNSNSNSNNTNINTINSNNKTFNLQVFLNEDCKDAMNLSDFVNSLQLQLSDLDNMGKLGYTEGISKIIISEMNDLEQTKRPVHCSDIKRETLYVKDEDKWEKEQPDHPKLNKAIRKIEQKNFGLMGEWQAEHPTYKESTSEENNEFIKLISQTVNGTPDNINKVIKKLAKEVIIDK